MTVAFILEDFPVISQTFIYNQIADLIDRGYKIKIFALNQTNEELRHEKIRNYKMFQLTFFKNNISIPRWKAFLLVFKTIYFNRKNINLKKFLQKFKFFSYQTKNFDIEFFNENLWILKDQNFDIIHAHFGHAGMFVADLKRAGFFKKTKFITTFHGYDLNPKKLDTLKNRYAKLFREVDLMTTNTLYSKTLLEQISSKSKIEILPVGLDTGQFKKKDSVINPEFKILFVGRLIELKGPKLAIDIIEILISRGINNLELIIAGEGKLREKIDSYIREKKLHTYVQSLGSVSQEKVVELMNNADVFILPGIYDKDGRAETQGLVIQEAQSMQLPVLISDVGGMKYGIIKGITGFVIKENDLEGFADKLEILLNDESLRKKMGKEGRLFVKKNYDSKVLGDRLGKIYFQLLN